MPSNEEKAAFVMEHVSYSEQWRSQYVERWIETLENFTLASSRGGFDTGNPYRKAGRGYGSTSLDSIFLKDPETHKAIMTYAAKLVRSILGDPHGEYIQAEPVGWEDAVKAAPTVCKLMRYSLSLPGHFRTLVEGIAEMLLFGTGIIEVGWRYEERDIPIRSATRSAGITIRGQEERMTVPAYDDVDLTVIDVQDFYPDPGEYRMERMRGAAKRFRTSLAQVAAKADQGIYNKSAAKDVESPKDAGSKTDDMFREGIDQPDSRRRMGQFKPMIGFEYWGEVPWDENDTNRRVVTVVDGALVRDEAWPLADPDLPWKSLVINPICGRFYGIAPGEVVRYDQDFADVLKELIARAIIRQVHPPIAFDPDNPDLDVAALRRWHTDMPIPARGGPASVGTLQYNANVGEAANILMMTKQAIQEGSGALGGIQGEPGPSREAATVGTMRIQAAMDRPELAAMMLERDGLPPIGKAILRRYQQFLGSEEDLTRRIGQLPEGLWIGDILADFDIRFVGSRSYMTRQQKMQAVQTFTQLAAAIPPLQASVDWGAFARRMVGDLLELPELAAGMPDPATMGQNMAMMQMLGGGGAGANGVGPAATPSLPEGQNAGGELAGGPLGGS